MLVQGQIQGEEGGGGGGGGGMSRLLDLPPRPPASNTLIPVLFMTFQYFSIMLQLCPF